jgi:hypothetical protein
MNLADYPRPSRAVLVVRASALAFVALLLAAPALGVASLACTPGQRQAARTAVDAATVACLIANATLPDAEVARVCSIVDGLDGPLKELLRASRTKVAEARAGGELAGASRCAK